MNKEKFIPHGRANDNEPTLNDAQIEYLKFKYSESTQRPKFKEIARELSNIESVKDFLEREMDILLDIVDQNDGLRRVTLANDGHLDRDTLRGPMTLAQSAHHAIAQSIYEATPVHYAETIPMALSNFQVGTAESASVESTMMALPQLHDSLVNVDPNTSYQFPPGIPVHTGFDWHQSFTPPENPIMHDYSTYGGNSETIGVPQHINMPSLYGQQVYFQPTGHSVVPVQTIPTSHAILPTQNQIFHTLGSESQQPLLRTLPSTSFLQGQLQRHHTTAHGGQSRALLKRSRRVNP